MTQKLYFIIAILCALAGTANTAQAETITKTYLFSGNMEGTACNGHFYVEGVTGTQYPNSPLTWTYGTTGSISFTLADGIGFTFASSSDKISVPSSEYLGGEGNVTFTVSGGTENYYIWRVEVYDRSNNTLFDEINWKDDNVEGTRTFSKTISAGTDGLSVKKIVITYSQQDYYLISSGTMTISGVNNEYVYTAGMICPEPTVVCNGVTLTKGTHYTLSYTNNVKIGTATVTVTGIEPYHGSVSKHYTIRALQLSDFNRLDDGSYEIASKADLDRLSDYVNSGNDCSGVTFRQTADIAYSGTLTGIGYFNKSPNSNVFEKRVFCGTYDGGSHVISGLKVQNNIASFDGTNLTWTEIYSGLFAGMENATIRNVCLVSPKIVNNVYLPSAYIDKAIVRGTNEIRLYSGGIAGYAAGCTIENCFVYNPQYVESISCNYSTKMTRYYPIVGKSTSTTTTPNSAQVYKATSGSNMSFSENSIASTDGFIYSGSRYYKESAAVALRYTGAAASAANTLTFTDGSGNALNLSGSGNPYTLTMPARNITVNAALVANELILANAADNSSAIATAATACANGKTYEVTLDGRTLWTDGAWNTLCLPFPLGNASAADGHHFDGTPLEGFTVMELDTETVYGGHKTGLDGSTLYLNFKDAKSITAGVPYIVKKDGTGGIANPVFAGVTVSAAAPAAVTSTDGKVQFKGTYDPISYAAADNSILFLGGENKLYWPEAGVHIGAFRAYFELGNGLTCGEPSSPVRAFNLGFGEGSEETGIISISKESRSQGVAGAWFDLNGRRLSGKPTARGIYVNNGRKVVVK